MSVSYIPEKTKILLWGKAAGRCQYRGCNECLYRDSLTQSEFNQAYIAHIIADSPDGPRGDEVLSLQLSKDLSNLMLLCDEHHRLVDKVDVAGHLAPVLQAMKQEHEDRIERITDIKPHMQSHIVTYKANVGLHTPIITYETVREHLYPTHYPALPYAIDLGLANSPQRDKNAGFWEMELDVLQEQFNDQLRPKFRKNEIKHLSVFAFAPQPLLIKLGTLLSDIPDVKVYQPIRNPKTWSWQNQGEDVTYAVIEPEKLLAKVALNISLSADIANERITSVLGEDCSIYTLRIERPFNNFMKTRKHFDDFSSEARRLLNHIKHKYNAQTPIHIFPAMPVAAAIELGRVWMPKADMPLVIYDENTANSGFFKALEIKNQ